MAKGWRDHAIYRASEHRGRRGIYVVSGFWSTLQFGSSHSNSFCHNPIMLRSLLLQRGNARKVRVRTRGYRRVYLSLSGLEGSHGDNASQAVVVPLVRAAREGDSMR